VIILALGEWGLAFGIGIVLLLFLVVGWVIVQGTRAQLYWRKRVDEGDVDAITALVRDEITRWKTARVPKGVDPDVWRGVQSVDLVSATPDGIRLSATAEGIFVTVDGERREVRGALQQAMAVTAKLADMAFYDIPNVRLPYVQVDVYSTFRDETGTSQRCVLATLCNREVADALDWDELSGEEVVRAFGGRYLLDDRGNPLPVDADATARSGVPAAFYRD
jgi:hypothetical protein